MNYYAFENNRTAGPYTLEELRAKFEKGELTAADQVCPQGTEAWQPLERILSPASAPTPFTPPVISPLTVKPKRRLGCGGCLLIGLASLAILGTGLLATSYYILVHTALPLRWAGQVLSGPNFAVQGISGSIASGISIQSLWWRDGNGGTGEAADLRFKYSGFFHFLRAHELIIEELRVGKADLTIASSPAESWSTNSPSPMPVAPGTGPSPAPTAPVSSPALNNPNPLRLLEIDRIHFSNVHVKDLRTGFELTMPEFDYSGFKWQPDSVDLGNLRIASDRLDVTTEAGRTVEIEGKPVAFQKFVEGTVKPLFDPSVKRPIAFTLDAGTTGSKAVFYRLTGFDGKLEWYTDGAHEGYCHTDDLALSDYLAFPPNDLPSHVTLDARFFDPATHDLAKQLVLTGKFTLGVTGFEIRPEETVVEKQQSGARYHFTAVHPITDGEIRITVQGDSGGSHLQLALGSTPAMDPGEILSRVFFGKGLSDLTPAERKQTDDRLPIYFPSAPTGGVEQ